MTEHAESIEKLKNIWLHFNSGSYTPDDVRDWLVLLGTHIAKEDMVDEVLRRNHELQEKLNAIKKVVC